MIQSKNLDQYYTADSVAKQCVKLVKGLYPFATFDTFLEPSAGTGAFFRLLPEDRRLGYDIEPKYDGIEKRDFLNVSLDKMISCENWLAIGNPPFGKNASLAVQFFNHCATHTGVSVIAFIVPRTFCKTSIKNRLHSYFHLVEQHDIESDSFIFNDAPYDVPCVFQIWERRQKKRDKIKTFREHPDLSFVSKEEANISLQRVGVKAGKIRTEKSDILTRAEESHFFLNVSEKVLENLLKIDFDRVKHNTAGNPSVSRSELIELYMEIIDG